MLIIIMLTTINSADLLMLVKFHRHLKVSVAYYHISPSLNETLTRIEKVSPSENYPKFGTNNFLTIKLLSWIHNLRYHSKVGYHLLSHFSQDASHFYWEELTTEAFGMEYITRKKLACISKATATMESVRDVRLSGCAFWVEASPYLLGRIFALL